MAHRIENFGTLAQNELRTDALSIAEAGFAAVDTGAAFARALRIENDELRIKDRVYPLLGRRIFFVGVGKCANAAAEAVEQLLGERLTGGIAFDVSPAEGAPLRKIEPFVGTHPLPTEANVQATKRIVGLLSDRDESDLVIVLISGGGSTLLCLPPNAMTCTNETALWNELTSRGASIQDINTVRKHLSLARGGGLAAAAHPAEVISLIISDVPGNDLGFIASGPTVPDETSVADAEAILTRYSIAPPTDVELTETPKDRDYFKRVTNVLFLSNEDALAAMQEEAVRRGYAASVVDDRIVGEAREVGHAVAEKLHDAPAKTVLLYAGESTVTLGSHYGKGGRNQEMALAALNELRSGELILPFASDGRDNTDRAGAISDEMTRAHVFAQNLSIEEHLDAHTAYDFFNATGDALITGYTGSNVSDLIIAIKQ